MQGVTLELGPSDRVAALVVHAAARERRRMHSQPLELHVQSRMHRRQPLCAQRRAWARDERGDSNQVPEREAYAITAWSTALESTRPLAERDASPILSEQQWRGSKFAGEGIGSEGCR